MEKQFAFGSVCGRIAFTGRIVLNGAKDHGPTWTRVAWNECVELIRL
jgi:hypothetical protein